MDTLGETLTAAEAGINWQTVAVVGVAAVAAVIGWKIFKSMTGKS